MLSQFPLTFHQIHNRVPCFIASDYFCAYWDGLCDHLGDLPWEDIFELSASTAARKFCEWVQVGIDVYIPHLKYQVKPYSSSWFSAACAAAIVDRNTSFMCFFLDMLKSQSLPRNLALETWQIANSVLSKGKSDIPPPFNSPDMLSSASDKAKLFAKNF